MPDIFTRRKRSVIMAAIRSHGNRATELRLIQIFRTHRITGWRRGCVIRGGKADQPRCRPGDWSRAGSSQQREDRRQKKQFSVRPDFVFPKLHVAVFVDGCFWHGCPNHGTKPKTNAAFWRKKIEGNKARDQQVNRRLHRRGWRVIRVWEHELRRRDEAKLIRRLLPHLCPRRP